MCKINPQLSCNISMQAQLSYIQLSSLLSVSRCLHPSARLFRKKIVFPRICNFFERTMKMFFFFFFIFLALPHIKTAHFIADTQLLKPCRYFLSVTICVSVPSQRFRFLCIMCYSVTWKEAISTHPTTNVLRITCSSIFLVHCPHVTKPCLGG